MSPLRTSGTLTTGRALRAGGTCSTLSSLRTGRSLNASKTLSANSALNTYRALSTDQTLRSTCSCRALGTRFTLGSLNPSGTLGPSGALRSLRTRNDFGTERANRQVRSGTRRDARILNPGVTLRLNWQLKATNRLETLGSTEILWAIPPLRTDEALWPERVGDERSGDDTLETLRSFDLANGDVRP